MAVAGELGILLPDRRMQTVLDAATHQGVVGRVELDAVLATAVAIEGVEDRRVLVGEAGEFEGLGRAPIGADAAEVALHLRAEQRFEGADQDRIGFEQVAPERRWRLVDRLVSVDGLARMDAMTPVNDAGALEGCRDRERVT